MAICERNAAAIAVAIMLSGAGLPARGDVPAQGVVIYQTDNAYPIRNWVDDDFYSDLKKPESLDQLQANLKMAVDNLRPTSEMLPKIFPIEPTLIKPVVLPGTQMLKDLPELPQPLFILGTDEYSIRWFESNKEVLTQYGAAGVLTKAKNQTEWEYMQKLVAPLQLWPMNADALTDQLGAPGYPIMITRSGFFQ